MARVFVRVERADDRWAVDFDARGLELERRWMPRIAGTGLIGGFPLPPCDEAAKIRDGEPHCPLCTAQHARDIHRLLIAIATATSAPPVLAMGRYLFACLIGEHTWRKLLQAAGGKPLELALTWSSDDAELTRLPWEMMRSGDRYLAQMLDPPVLITRRVAASEDDPALLLERIVPRVLFAVGSDASDQSIESGLEYLALLRQLEAGQLPLMSHPLVSATPRDIRDAVDRFCPSVLHLVGHGVVDKGVGYLELRSDLPGEENQPLPQSPSQLRNLVARPGKTPAIVVLNACHTGAQASGERVTAPMAVELVRGGVPMVIGMGGRVADRVCRLFTRRFYMALLEGTPLVEAAAEGRREGFELGSNPDSSADWAFPTIFLDERIATEITVDAERLAQLKTLAACARDYRRQRQPRAFCGRLDLVDEALRNVIGAPPEAAGAQTASSVPATTVLVVEEDHAPLNHHYGKTRLLMELAAEAVHAGHVPCLLTSENPDDPVDSAADLADLLIVAIGDTRDRFGLHNRDFELRLLEEHLSGGTPASELQAGTREALARVGRNARREDDALHPRLLTAALEQDFKRLVDDARKLPLQQHARAVLLLDSVHRYGEGALGLLLGHFVRSPGFGPRDDPVPIIFTSAPHGLEQEHGQVVRMLNEFASSGGGDHVRRVVLSRLLAPSVDPLPYRQYLFGWDEQFVVRANAEPSATKDLFDLLDLWVQGAPSRLTSDGVTATVLSFKRDVLEPARDLRLLPGGPP